MGAVQKLATVVIIGLVGFATLLIIYLADEPNRHTSTETTQQELAIERGTELFITYCLQCHGPDGLGYTGPEGQARIGAPINTEDNQSNDPVISQQRAEFIRYRIINGVPPDPNAEKIMLAFGPELNGEQIDDLVFMVQNADWDYVYNQSVLETGQLVAEQTCLENPEDPVCANIDEAPAIYPTAPSQEPPEAEQQPAQAEGGGATLEAVDTAWSTNELTVRPGDTITVTNTGVGTHDFTVDELGITQDLPNGEPVTITIPADAQPGEFAFYCSVPGHREQGMEGTLIIEG